MVMMAVAAALVASPVTVEIVTSGHIETPADRFRVTGSVLACAATQAEADTLLTQKIAAIDRTMTALGATRASVATNVSLVGMMGGLMTMRGTSDCNPLQVTLPFPGDSPSGTKETPEKVLVGANAALAFDAPDRAAAGRAIAALKAADAKPADKALPVLLDDSAARRAAKQQALTQARAEAAAYAGPLGAGAPVLVAISERQDFGSLDFFAKMMRTIGLPMTGASDKVVTDVTLTVQFWLDGR